MGVRPIRATTKVTAAALSTAVVAVGLALAGPTTGAAAAHPSERSGPPAHAASGATDTSSQGLHWLPLPKRTFELQVLALNDFHGNLAPNPPTSSSGNVNGIPAGGAEYLTAHLRQLRAQAKAEKKHSVTVAAGDLIGASPLLSAAFHDEPTIEALDAAGLSVASVGNHEFDEGWQELLRLQKGGCIDDGDGRDNQNSCPDPEQPFDGANFDYLSANVFHEDTGRTLLKPYVVKRFGHTRVAFIGMTLEDTPNIVTKKGVEGLEFTDEVETANALVPKLKRRGVEAMVLLLHEGGFPEDPTAYDACPGISGPVVDIASKLDPEIDVIISGHTHQAYNCTLPDPAGKPRQVTSAASFGKVVTELTLTIDRFTRDVVRTKSTATNRIVTRDVPEAADITSLIEKYTTLVEPIAGKVIGHLSSESVIRDTDDSLESPLGNLIADSMLADPSVVVDGKEPQIALMNPGGIRADLVAADNGEVTFGAAFTVQPFNNYLVSLDFTGEQILELLEQQWSGDNAGGEDHWKVLQVAGLSYTWDKDAPEGSKVVADSVTIGGEALEPTATYRVVTNSFLADGGDGFPVFTQGANSYYGGLDIDALAAYLTANDPYTPVPTDRIDLAD